MKRERGLGRGFASLIPEGLLEDSRPALGRQRMVPIGEIVANPEQPRTVFAPDELRSLADSIRVHGVLAPLLVRPGDGRYVLIAGERRLRAAALVGLDEVPVLLKDDLGGGAAQLEVALIENLQRSDLDPVEAARGFQRLVETYGYTQRQIADRVGKNRATIANAIRLLKLPDFVLSVLREGQISAGHARAMLPLGDARSQRDVLARVVSGGLSVRATERLVAGLVRTPVRDVRREARDKGLDHAVQVLERTLHTSVQITARKRGGGRIVIDWADGEDLERLVTRLRSRQE